MPITDADLVVEVKATPVDNVAIAPRVAAHSAVRDSVPMIKASSPAKLPRRDDARHPYLGGGEQRKNKRGERRGKKKGR